MVFWLSTVAAVCYGVAAVVGFVRYGKVRKNSQLFVCVANLVTAAIFSYLAYRSMP